MYAHPIEKIINQDVVNANGLVSEPRWEKTKTYSDTGTKVTTRIINGVFFIITTYTDGTSYLKVYALGRGYDILAEGTVQELKRYAANLPVAEINENIAAAHKHWK